MSELLILFSCVDEVYGTECFTSCRCLDAYSRSSEYSALFTRLSGLEAAQACQKIDFAASEVRTCYTEASKAGFDVQCKFGLPRQPHVELSRPYFYSAKRRPSFHRMVDCMQATLHIDHGGIIARSCSFSACKPASSDSEKSSCEPFGQQPNQRS